MVCVELYGGREMFSIQTFVYQIHPIEIFMCFCSNKEIANITEATQHLYHLYIRIKTDRIGVTPDKLNFFYWDQFSYHTFSIYSYLLHITLITFKHIG